jgi:hypothetical protein
VRRQSPTGPGVGSTGPSWDGGYRVTRAKNLGAGCLEEGLNSCSKSSGPGVGPMGRECRDGWV